MNTEPLILQSPGNGLANVRPPNKAELHNSHPSAIPPDDAPPIMDTIATEKRIDAAFRFPYYLDRSQMYTNWSEAGDEWRNG
jgi:hypothetical protein